MEKCTVEKKHQQTTKTGIKSKHKQLTRKYETIHMQHDLNEIPYQGYSKEKNLIRIMLIIQEVNE